MTAIPAADPRDVVWDATNFLTEMMDTHTTVDRYGTAGSQVRMICATTSNILGGGREVCNECSRFFDIYQILTERFREPK